MDKREIINLWKSVGWNSLKDYHDYLNSSKDGIILSELDPDKIDPKEFWRAADEHFGTDPVCNHANYGGDKKMSVFQSNLENYKIPLMSGMISQTDFVVNFILKKVGKLAICEIGCGYGSFYVNYVDSIYDDNVHYTGFDIIPRFEGATEILGKDGCFSEEQVEGCGEKFNLFYSANTFQHLSKKQTEKYLTQVYSMLPYEGYFNLMYVDAEHSYHYGQFIQLFGVKEFTDLVRSIGYKIVGYSTLELPNSLTPFSFIFKK